MQAKRRTRRCFNFRKGIDNNRAVIERARVPDKRSATVHAEVIQCVRGRFIASAENERAAVPQLNIAGRTVRFPVGKRRARENVADAFATVRRDRAVEIFEPAVPAAVAIGEQASGYQKRSLAGQCISERRVVGRAPHLAGNGGCGRAEERQRCAGRDIDCRFRHARADAQRSLGDADCAVKRERVGFGSNGKRSRAGFFHDARCFTVRRNGRNARPRRGAVADIERERGVVEHDIHSAGRNVAVVTVHDEFSRVQISRNAFDGELAGAEHGNAVDALDRQRFPCGKIDCRAGNCRGGNGNRADRGGRVVRAEHKI